MGHWLPLLFEALHHLTFLRIGLAVADLMVKTLALEVPSTVNTGDKG